MTPTGTAGRHLGSRHSNLGFSPDNVEWRFRQVRKAQKTRNMRKPLEKKVEAPKLTAADKKAFATFAKEERRRKLAEEFKRWEAMREPSAGGRRIG